MLEPFLVFVTFGFSSLILLSVLSSYMRILQLIKLVLWGDAVRTISKAVFCG